MQITVVTGARSNAIGEGLTYESDAPVAVGSLVEVPLRKKSIEGMVVAAGNEPPGTDFTVRPIIGLLSATPLLPAALIHTLIWMTGYYKCSLRQALAFALPSSPWAALIKKTQKVSILKEEPIKSAKQKDIVDLLKKGPLTKEMLLKHHSVSSSALQTLLKKGILILRTEEEMSHSISPRSPVQEKKTPQGDAIMEETKPMLLVDASGKERWHVYRDLISRTLQEGKQVIIVTPDILRSEFAALELEHYASSVILLHSDMTPKRRRDVFQQIHRGDVSLVIGTRTALFAPCHALGLVIVDDEHEWTMKSDRTPRFHVRETAEVLCKHSNAHLVFGSASPSLEAWHAATVTKKFRTLTLTQPEKLKVPTLCIDLAESDFGKSYPLTPPLVDALRECKKRKEQAVLFVNHRGAASGIVCRDCRNRILSPESGVPFTVHKDVHGAVFLMDHQTGVIEKVPTVCPHCNSVNLFPIGTGTQGIEALVKRFVPDARIARIDRDVFVTAAERNTFLRTMKEDRIDILIGTQAVLRAAKYPRVTLAAAVVADIGLSAPTFRAGEHVFQHLMTLKSALSGKKHAQCIIQSFRPESPELQAVVHDSIEEYLQTELTLRRTYNYPPFSKIIRLIFRGEHARGRAEEYTALLRARAERENVPCTVTCIPSAEKAGVWLINIRGHDPHALLAFADLRMLIVDADPWD